MIWKRIKNLNVAVILPERCNTLIIPDLFYIGCGDPTNIMISNGMLDFTPSFPSFYNPGDTLDYTCNMGFGSRDPAGDFITMCQSGSFTWNLDDSGNFPECLAGKFCQIFELGSDGISLFLLRKVILGSKELHEPVAVNLDLKCFCGVRVRGPLLKFFIFFASNCV